MRTSTASLLCFTFDPKSDTAESWFLLACGAGACSYINRRGDRSCHFLLGFPQVFPLVWGQQHAADVTPWLRSITYDPFPSVHGPGCWSGVNQQRTTRTLTLSARKHNEETKPRRMLGKQGPKVFVAQPEMGALNVERSHENNSSLPAFLSETHKTVRETSNRTKAEKTPTLDVTERSGVKHGLAARPQLTMLKRSTENDSPENRSCRSSARIRVRRENSRIIQLWEKKWSRVAAHWSLHQTMFSREKHNKHQQQWENNEWRGMWNSVWSACLVNADKQRLQLNVSFICLVRPTVRNTKICS